MLPFTEATLHPNEELVCPSDLADSLLAERAMPGFANLVAWRAVAGTVYNAVSLGLV